MVRPQQVLIVTCFLFAQFVCIMGSVTHNEFSGCRVHILPSWFLVAFFGLPSVMTILPDLR